MSEIWRKLLHRSKPMCVVLQILMCVLSIGFCRQFSCRVKFYRFPSWKDSKRCKSLLSRKSVLLLSSLLLYLSLTESLCVQLKQIRFRIENIRTDVFRCGADLAQYRSIKWIYCNPEATCNYSGFRPKLAGVFLSPNVYFHFWASVRI